MVGDRALSQLVRRGSDQPGRSGAIRMCGLHTSGTRCWPRTALSSGTFASVRRRSPATTRRSSPARPKRARDSARRQLPQRDGRAAVGRSGPGAIERCRAFRPDRSALCAVGAWLSSTLVANCTLLVRPGRRLPCLSCASIRCRRHHRGCQFPRAGAAGGRSGSPSVASSAPARLGGRRRRWLVSLRGACG